MVFTNPHVYFSHLNREPIRYWLCKLSSLLNLPAFMFGLEMLWHFLFNFWHWHSRKELVIKVSRRHCMFHLFLAELVLSAYVFTTRLSYNLKVMNMVASCKSFGCHFIYIFFNQSISNYAFSPISKTCSWRAIRLESWKLFILFSPLYIV